MFAPRLARVGLRAQPALLLARKHTAILSYVTYRLFMVAGVSPKHLFKHMAILQPSRNTPSVVEAGKDASYLAVILFGCGLTAVFAYSLLGELGGGTSTNSLYSKSFKRVAADEKVKELLGDNIKAHGEETRRGRRRHIASQEYEVDGEVYVRLRYYVEGSRDTGTVHAEVHKKGRSFDYRYLFVEVPGQGFPSEHVILEDNR